jgi:hypothetical protein
VSNWKKTYLHSIKTRWPLKKKENDIKKDGLKKIITLPYKISDINLVNRRIHVIIIKGERHLTNTFHISTTVVAAVK